MADAGARLVEEGNHDMCVGNWGKSENECISEEELTESTIRNKPFVKINNIIREFVFGWRCRTAESS